jgi:tRNA G18 (ribose-2'-O)-methylase SpoU
MLGFSFHRGVLASVRVPGPTAVPVDALATLHAPLVAVAVGFTDPSNVGALIRAARALCVDHVLVDADGADPYARKAIRASAGHVFSVGMTRVRGLLEQTLQLRDQLGAELLALTPSGDRGLHLVQGASARVVAFGSEGPGLPVSWLEAADARVRIDLADDVDSLNVASAAAVTFYALDRARAPHR